MVVTKTPSKITTLQSLVKEITNGDKSTFTKILRSTSIEASEFQKVAFWSDTSYCRNCIIENEHFELILICWEKGQSTPIHGHDGEECWVYFADGQLKETIYTRDVENQLSPSKVSLPELQSTTFMTDEMGFHKLENIADGRSISLHLYAKPIQNCKVFDESKSEFVTTKLKYDTFVSLS